MARMGIEMRDQQRAVCLQVGAPNVGCNLHQKVGISRNVKEGLRPLNGLRIQPEGDTTGWYIWAGEEFSEASDFFVPLHVVHLADWAPLVIPYLGLPPGWRFLLTEHYEDVWEDRELLKQVEKDLFRSVR
ncbi:immunity protein Imm33 domain-containing protein [Ralstonia pseudosolanacearum]|uniref:immunity protein Imm33 domain-containing protein n=1 Tax=Ralstonia pseudosolanacearum TaxID=1310165 RepID=UPI001E6247C5|nr:hypothetical protein [Ralstonia pseudosolanacearum]BEU64308.1 hypothetical protein MAFF301524_41080 [Ralstonia pseudosolanacearum]